MENFAAHLHCPNPQCQEVNTKDASHCRKCQTPLIQPLLWAMGAPLSAYKPGEAIAERYLLVEPFAGGATVVDTKPAVLPEVPEEVPDSIVPYLKLLPCYPHVPLVHGYVPQESGEAIWLLSHGHFRRQHEPEALGKELLPRVESVWSAASPVRQLHWWWQMARLWQPLSDRGVVGALLEPNLLRVNGSLIQLLELPLDIEDKDYNLSQLGELWRMWLGSSSSPVEAFGDRLCACLEGGELRHAEHLVNILERALEVAGRTPTYTYEVCSATHSGPQRDHNEDAYHDSNRSRPKPARNSLSIVCDGIGGHEGGEIASDAAISVLRDRLQPLLKLSDAEWDSALARYEFEEAIAAANRAISERNDSEHRKQRQRMGTTLVTVLAREGEWFVAHVGDSRAYRISRTCCHQITLDDDLATRAVRLGYELYESAVRQPGAGSLVQALGTTPSDNLYPTIQRWVQDEDCILLLCSDGLSDNNRVEQYWESEILPLLDGKVGIETAVNRAIEIANERNGHDNVTVSLICCRTQDSDKAFDFDLAGALDEWLVGAKTTAQSPATSSYYARRTRLARWRAAGILALAIAVGGLGVSYATVPPVREFVDWCLERINPLSKGEIRPWD